MLLRLHVRTVSDTPRAVEQSASTMMHLLLELLDKQLEQGLQVGHVLCTRPAALCLLMRF